jgi:hypothetical protein
MTPRAPGAWLDKNKSDLYPTKASPTKKQPHKNFPPWGKKGKRKKSHPKNMCSAEAMGATFAVRPVDGDRKVSLQMDSGDRRVGGDPVCGKHQVCVGGDAPAPEVCSPRRRIENYQLNHYYTIVLKSHINVEMLLTLRKEKC